jgi:glycosyltransferase involved in cell wall biosynthesis
MKKKITCFAPTNIQSIFAHSINFFKTAEGFSFNDLVVDIVCRDKFYPFGILNQFSSIFKNNKNIKLNKLPYIKPFRRLDENEDFEFQVKNYLKNNKTDFAYFRSYNGPKSTIENNIPTAIESHAHPTNQNFHLSNMLKLSIDKNFKALFTISNVLKKSFVAKKVPETKIHILSDGYDDRIFFPLEKKNNSSKVVTYFGHLYEYKGVFTLLNAAKYQKNVIFKLVGGSKKDLKIVNKFIRSNNLKNVFTYGHIKMNNLRNYISDTDIFLLPPSGNHPSALWTSPLKLCEYFALKKPVIASDIPALRDWLVNDEVYFFEADNYISLSKTIEYVFENYEEAKNKIINSDKFILDKSYKNRSKIIINKLV